MNYVVRMILCLSLWIFCFFPMTSFASSTASHVDIGSSKELAIEYVKIQNPSIDAAYVVDCIWRECEAMGIIDKTAVLALFETETNFHHIPSSDGYGYGVGQLSWGQYEAFDLSSDLDIQDLGKNIHGSIYYFRYMLEKTGGDPVLAYKGYNGGEGAIQKFWSDLMLHATRYLSVYNRLKTGDPGVGYVSGFSAILDLLGMNKSLDLDMSYFFTMGKSLRTVMNQIVDISIKALQIMITISYPLLALFAMIDFSIFLWKQVILTGSFSREVYTGITNRLFKYSFLSMILMGWKTIINEVFMGTASWVFSTLGNESIMNDVSAPDTQVQHLISFLNPSVTWLGEQTIASALDHLGLFCINYFVTYASFFIIILLVLSIMITYIEFYIGSAFSVLGVSFLPFSGTQFIAEGFFSLIVNCTMKLLILGVILGASNSLFSSSSYDPTSVLEVFMAFFTILTISGISCFLPSRIASSLQMDVKL